MSTAPILDNKYAGAPSVFEPAALLREARRQKGLLAANVPPVCVLDPDGDIMRFLKGFGAARPISHGPAITPRFTVLSWPAKAPGSSAVLSAHHLPSWSRKNSSRRGADCLSA